MSRLDAAMSKLKMDTTVQSAESRVSKLVSDFEVVLVRLSMVRFAEAEPKLTVDYLDAAVQPPAVRAHVKELMKLNENGGLKKDARDFKRWLADYMRRYGEFEPLKAAAVPATAKSDKLPAATKTPKAGKVPKVVAVLNCPKVADGEAKLLMERARSIWKETKLATVVETVVSHELVDDLAKKEEELLPLEMDSCFPDMVAVDATAETTKVKEVLDAKVVEALTADCGSEFVAKLAALLDKYVDAFVSIAEAKLADPDDVLSRMTKSLEAVHLVVCNKGLLAWLDDLLGYHRTLEELLGVADVLAVSEAAPEKVQFLRDRGQVMRAHHQ
ncbi:hypothetical protein DYB37_012624 [Aphanomyces astaci]|uniref:Uncharacterized protein n=1 Tax=Aphanomyces astaci TaxID=112090 RepID=A0A3R7B0Y5_APHAT|nr:hypothetical protein DYB37_012624 [Aphanomyces astaci]